MVKDKHIFLIGFSGSGKSTIGPPLARLLKARFYDTDTLVERRGGNTIDRIFSDGGEAMFRQLESQVIVELIRNSKSRMVIALGGGAFLKRKNRIIAERHGIVIYLSCSIEEIYKRMKRKTDRPLLRVSPAKRETERQAFIRRIKELLVQRRPTYFQAHIKVSTTNRDVSETVRKLYRKVRSYNAGH